MESNNISHLVLQSFHNLSQWNMTNHTYHIHEVSVSSMVIGALAGMIAAFTLILNSTILIVFAIDSHIRTPFNIYILNLTFQDWTIAAFSMTGFVALAVSPGWPWGWAYCGVFLYLDWATSACGLYSVALISLDRLWALFWPIHYRQRRNGARTSALICLGTWTYIQVVIAPCIAMDRFLYGFRDPRICAANQNAQPMYNSILGFSMYMIPLMIVFFSYTGITIKLRKRKKPKAKVSPLDLEAPRTVGTDTGPSSHTHNHSTSSDLHHDQKAKDKKARKASPVPTAATTRSKEEKEMKKREQRLFRSLLTLSLVGLICWSPGIFYYMVSSIAPAIFSETFFNLVVLLRFVSCGINPIVYHFSLPDVRKAVEKLFRIG
ncbi:hypothetical protein RvY_19068 [Ramazzottius varieornatus]|uniref:G-protein coupled receptors family 1 profile domain-containing protein n=1 Tax=Ramazzottius varieornatus TaxID=947166 RepID=A0A1D1W854_RAMVA|nr:hypothetical protein RvY_19068 [Ramazzottius varieornatus]